MLTDDDIKRLEADHKRIAVVRAAYDKTAKKPDGSPAEPPWECVFRKPTRAEYKMFRARANNESTKSEAQENLALATVVYPTRAAFDALLDDYPAIPEAAAGRIAELAGFAVEESGK